MNGITKSRDVLVIGIMICITASANSQAVAESLDYGDFEGDSVMYRSVIENSVTNPNAGGPREGLGIYGEPVIDGNILNFNVPSFFALAQDDDHTDIADGLITFGLEPIAGNQMALTRLAIREFGSVSFFTFFGGTAAADAAAPLFISITEVLLDDGTDDGLPKPLDNPVVLESSLEILSETNVAPEWNSNDHPDTIGWVAEAEVDLLQSVLDELPTVNDEHPLVGVTRFQFSMNNTLTAAVDHNLAISFIDKKHLEFRPTVAIVPEPACSGLVFVALLLLRRSRFGRG